MLLRFSMGVSHNFRRRFFVRYQRDRHTFQETESARTILAFHAEKTERPAGYDTCQR